MTARRSPRRHNAAKTPMAQSVTVIDNVPADASSHTQVWLDRALVKTSSITHRLAELGE